MFMERINFNEQGIKKINLFEVSDDKHGSGQITIVGGSNLFHGAPILALKNASRLASMVYFSSPDADSEVAEKMKATLSSFVWVPRDDIESYIKKSEVILIGPGLMRSRIREQSYVCDDEGEKTRKLTLGLFNKYPTKKWIVDGGSLQVIKVTDLPQGALVTPNMKEFEMLFGEKVASNADEREQQLVRLAQKYQIVILIKDEVSMVSDGENVITIRGGNDGLVKGGIGDVIAGISAGLMVRNSALIAAAAASYLVKKAAENLAEGMGLMFNADDVADRIPVILKKLTT